MKHEEEHVIEQIKQTVRENASELMDISRGILSNIVNDELFDELDPRIQAVMLSSALCDYATDLKANAFTEGYLKHILEDKEPVYATAVYIYCNWRVFATYKSDEELAHKYQAICDRIDDYVFDHWSKENVRFFVEQTD